MEHAKLPPLPLKNWLNTKTTLHLYLQILGKLKLKLMPRKNHWWNITFHVNSKGLTSGPIPLAGGMETFELQFNFLHHRLEIISSTGLEEKFDLSKGVSVAEFYSKTKLLLSELLVELDEIYDKPFDLPFDKHFGDITEYRHYDKNSISDYWQILRWIHHHFTEFSGRFYGKTCPVQLYWHSFDLVVTRFNGKKAQPMPSGARISDKDAYTHENISFGFWPGDDNLPEPAFYSYTYPAPEGIDREPLQPNSAAWIQQNGSPMALLKYHDLLKEKDPGSGLFNFLESAYQAGAKNANWPIGELTVPRLSDL